MLLVVSSLLGYIDEIALRGCGNCSWDLSVLMTTAYSLQNEVPTFLVQRCDSENLLLVRDYCLLDFGPGNDDRLDRFSHSL